MSNSVTINVISEGYSTMKNGLMFANATCTVVKTPKSVIIFDTMTPWDGQLIRTKMEELGIALDDVNFVISSHGHPDHTGNNNLFLKAKHIVGFCIHQVDQFEIFPFEQGKEYVIDDWTKVIPTPGHTNEDVSLEVTQPSEPGKTIIAGDLFESEEDLDAPHIWMGNSFDPYVQAKNRLKILEIAYKVIPGHGGPFIIKPEHIQAAKNLCDSFEKERLATKSNQK